MPSASGWAGPSSTRHRRHGSSRAPAPAGGTATSWRTSPARTPPRRNWSRATPRSSSTSTDPRSLPMTTSASTDSTRSWSSAGPAFLTVRCSPRGGKSLQVDLEGAGGGSWHWGLGEGESPPADKKPDAFIQGRAPQFALVAARRLTPDDVLDAGIVVMGGDADLAEIVLRHIRAYP